MGRSDSGISDFDVKNYLNKTKDDAAKMILFWIELYRRKAPTYDIQDLEYRYTLEHIMPQKWEQKWKEVPIVDGNQVLDADSLEGKQFRNEAVQALGNKTLLGRKAFNRNASCSFI